MTTAIEEILLIYGPLGLMTLISLSIATYLWKQLKLSQQCKHDLTLQMNEKQLVLMRELIKHEKETIELYVSLASKLERSLDIISTKLENK